MGKVLIMMMAFLDLYHSNSSQQSTITCIFRTSSTSFVGILINFLFRQTVMSQIGKQEMFKAVIALSIMYSTT